MFGLDNLDKWIRCGPQAVESILAKNWPGLDQPTLKYDYFLQEIPRRSGHPAYVSFLLGYLHQQAALCCSIPGEKESHFKNAVAQYQSFLITASSGNPDTNYFAQWQVGVIQQALGHPWPQIEESYLKTLEIDQSRGEALADILTYRCSREEWRIAYIYSSYCIKRFLGNRPHNRFWQVDDSFYSWEILRYHLPVLLYIRKYDEIERLLAYLDERMLQSPEIFTERDRLTITKVKNRVEEALSEPNKI